MAKAKKAVPATVDEFMAALAHPLKPEIEAVRKIILGAGKGIGEGIKWNAPSFHTGEHFATFNLRATDSIQLIFHLGAKVKDNSTGGLQITDPEGLLKWLAKERCIATLRDMKDVKARGAALADIVRQWIRFV
jgi:Domain of unknown function (DU1801)